MKATRWLTAGVLIAVLAVPVALVFIVPRKHLMRGTTAGAVKG